MGSHAEAGEQEDPWSHLEAVSNFLQVAVQELAPSNVVSGAACQASARGMHPSFLNNSPARGTHQLVVVGRIGEDAAGPWWW